MVKVIATANFHDGDDFRRYGDEFEVSEARAEQLIGYRIVNVIGKAVEKKAKVDVDSPKATKAAPKKKTKKKE